MIEYYYDTFGRSTGYAINGVRQTTIDYDSFGRISTMTVPATENGENVHSPTPTQSSNSFHWTYLQGSDLKASLAYPNGLTASWTYDANNQLLQVKNTYPSDGLGRDGSPLPSAGVISQFDYTYDAAGRRTAIMRSGSAFGDLSGSVDTYTYNARSELTSARRTTNGQPIPGFSEDFDYDPIGNRRSSATYNEKGEAQTSTYQANNLNQYTSRTTPGYAAVRGEAAPETTVTVNENPAFRLGSYYFGSDLFDNSTAGGLANLETYATLGQFAANGEEADDLVSATTNQVYLAQSPDTFAYDDDGNQTLITTKTGLWRVTYNGENRPIRWVRDSDNTTLTMAYDYKGRRRVKNDQRFFYDGYLQVADNTGNAYAWDVTEPIATRLLVWTKNDISSYYDFDGNKNVSEVIAADGSVSAHYEYITFGEVVLQHDVSAMSNPWRFSSEFGDEEIGCSYYNYRLFGQIMGSWFGRDPIGESFESCPSLYLFVCNNPINNYDAIGLDAPNLGGVLLPADRNSYCEELKGKFEEWYNVEKKILAEENWVSSLPKCPKKLAVKTVTVKYYEHGEVIDQRTVFVKASPNGSEWLLTSLVEFYGAQLFGVLKTGAAFHPEGRFELRTKDPQKYNGHGNQCIYDKCGNLLTEIPSAGSVDYASPNGSRKEHVLNDVDPFVWARKLDSECGGGESKWVRKYYEVRPAW